MRGPLPILGAAALWAAAQAAVAHDGHFLAGSHWHATDAWGFGAAAVAVLLVLWRGRK